VGGLQAESHGQAAGRSRPQFTPTQRELDDVELLRMGLFGSPGPDVFWPTGAGEVTGAVAEAVESDRPTGLNRGVVVFFTGLSGSGKSTLAQSLCNRLVESGGRTVTLLDGDRVRRNVSRGLTFSREDRERNIERIAWIAAEVARHGGLAVCAPIAPFDHTRKAARAMAEEVGADFALIHVATPLEVCEARDRKGLYQRARRGEVADFTGISSPYEVPTDADMVIDTSTVSVDRALAELIAFLQSRGWLPPGDQGGAGAESTEPS
jgi:sulfate adenylyltransferase